MLGVLFLLIITFTTISQDGVVCKKIKKNIPRIDQCFVANLQSQARVRLRCRKALRSVPKQQMCQIPAACPPTSISSNRAASRLFVFYLFPSSLHTSACIFLVVVASSAGGGGVFCGTKLGSYGLVSGRLRRLAGLRRLICVPRQKAEV